MPVFALSSAQFSIAAALLVPIVSGGEVVWGLEIDASGALNGIPFSPTLRFDSAITTEFGALSSWRELPPRSGSWREPDADPQALFYLFEHTGVRDCDWALDLVRGRLHLHLTAKVDAFFDEGEFGAGVPLEISTELAVPDFPMGRISRSAALRRYRATGLKDPVKFTTRRGVARLVFQ